MSDAFEQFRDADFEQMKRVERALIDAMVPFRDQTDPLLAVLALVRVIRVMLRAAPKQSQRQLTPVLMAYLEGRTRLPGDGTDITPLWTPPRRH